MIDAPATSRERAYTVWRECGQNLTETARILKQDHDYEISRRSLQEWKKKYGWEERAARAEAEEISTQESTSDESLLTVLLAQKTKYEKYFNTLDLGVVDNQAIYAYNNILKTLLDIRDKLSGDQVLNIDRPKLFLEDLEFVAETLKEIDPAGLKVLGENFDTIVKRFKEQCSS